jgi:hypothetical protein
MRDFRDAKVMARALRDADQWPQVGPDRPVIRVNWPRVAFAGLLAATVTILVTLRFQATREQNPRAASGGPAAAIEVRSAPKADFQARSEQNPEVVSDRLSSATEVLSATRADLSPTLQLVAEPAAQGRYDRLPLGISIRGPSEIASTATIEIVDLPNGWALSAGRPLGNRWRIPAAKLSGAAMLPPRRFSGAVDLEVELRLADDTLVERRSVHRAMTDPELAAQETMLFLSKAESLLVQRDISAARLVLPGRERWQRPRRAVTWRDIRGMFALPPLQRGRRPYHSANLV